MKVDFEFCNRNIKYFEFEISTVPKKGQLISFDNLKSDYGLPVDNYFKVKEVNITYNLKTMSENITITLKAIN
jgi:hypothetical protein